MRVLHLGNIANNGYNNAKLLRRLGIEADVIIYDYEHIMGSPEWEDADFEGKVSEWHPNWSEVSLNGFKKPDWVFQLNYKRYFKGQVSILALFKLPYYFVKLKTVWEETKRILKAYGIKLNYKDFFIMARFYEHSRPLKKYLDNYDIIQAYGVEPVWPFLLLPDKPLVSFEHGTLRDVFNGGLYNLLI